MPRKKSPTAKADSKKQRAYNSKPEQKKNRAARNKARREAMKEGRVKKGDGKDMSHKKGLAQGGGNSKSNLKVEKASTNRKRGAKLGGKRSSGGGRPRGS